MVVAQSLFLLNWTSHGFGHSGEAAMAMCGLWINMDHAYTSLARLEGNVLL